MLMYSAAKQSQQLALVLRDIGLASAVGENKFKPTIKEGTRFLIGSPMLVRGDNQAALALARDAYITDRSKYIDITYYYQRDLIKRGRLNIKFIGILDIVADRLTKPLA